MSTSAAPIDAKHAALLVMDYQTGILSRLSDADAVVAKAAQAIATVRQAGGTVGFVRVAFATADEVNPRMVERFGGSVDTALQVFNADAPATQIDARVAPQPGDVSVRKCRVGAFSTTDLHEQLQAREIDTLILAGISTSGVTLSTVRDASDRDYRVVVLSDACADRNAAVHEALTELIFPTSAEVITTAELAELL